MTHRSAREACERWAASGGMWLTGHAGQPPLLGPAPVLTLARELAEEFGALSAAVGRRVEVDAALELFGRAAVLGGRRRGRASIGGSCRLLASVEGWVAVNLARADDVRRAVDLLGGDEARCWRTLADALARPGAGNAIEGLAAMDVPLALLGEAAELRPRAVVVQRHEARPGRQRRAVPLVVDLSSMWAGPLCARLLGLVGGRVIKVESRERPDGTRDGPAAIFDWLHGGHESVALTLGDARQRADLDRLVRAADVVIESSRSHALRRLGIDAEQIACRGATWISITGYGRTRAGELERPAFGDDAAVAGGLVGRDRAGDPTFCADAIADPLSGLAAAVAGLRDHANGGGSVVEVAMAAVAAAAAERVRQAGIEFEDAGLRYACGDCARAGSRYAPVAPPRPWLPPARGPALGAHNVRVLAAAASSACGAAQAPADAPTRASAA